MAVSSKFILQQGRVLAGLGRTALAAAKQQVVPPSGEAEVPGPLYERTLEPPSADLVSAYVREVGGDPGEYRHWLPPHLWPQWGMGLAARTLIGLPYPLSRALNAGSRLEIRDRLPAGEPLEVSAQLVDVDDNGRRALLHQRVVTGTASAPQAIVGHMYALVPLKSSDSKDKGDKKKDKPRAPDEAQEVDRWSLAADDGLDFAKLTGDFNPIHWLAPYARAAGFPNVILHGFATMARTYESLNLRLGIDLDALDVKFTRPLVLPADVALYRAERELFVADTPGGEAYMTGTFEADDG